MHVKYLSRSEQLVSTCQLYNDYFYTHSTLERTVAPRWLVSMKW